MRADVYFEGRGREVLGLAPLLLLSILCVVSCERSRTTIEQDKQRYGLISAGRQPGSPCFPDDSASIQRRRFHPLGPTGGWGPLAEVDTNRQHETVRNEFSSIAGDIAGYVQFPVSGRLMIRSYDDVYGDVYCGWSPGFVEYEPQLNSVYAVFSRCVVGDGGLDQVHEICWFPEGEEIGEVIYSSAYKAETELKPHELFLPGHIGYLAEQGEEEYFIFNSREADKTFDSLLLAGQLDQARDLVSVNLSRIEHLPSALDGSTRTPIPSSRFHCDTIVKLLLLKAGLDLFDPSAQTFLSTARETLADGKELCFGHPYAPDLMDLYDWAVKRVQGETVPVPQSPNAATRVHGYDPNVIAELISDPTLTDRTLKKSVFSLGGESSYFWLGLREYLSDNREEAFRYLSLFTASLNQGVNDFELAAAASLKARIAGH